MQNAGPEKNTQDQVKDLRNVDSSQGSELNVSNMKISDLDESALKIKSSSQEEEMKRIDSLTYEAKNNTINKLAISPARSELSSLEAEILEAQITDYFLPGTYINELGIKELTRLNTNDPDNSENNRKIVQDKANKLMKLSQSNEALDINTLQDRAKVQHQRLKKALSDKGLDVDNNQIQKDITELMEKHIIALWKGNIPNIPPSQYADKLYNDYTGAILDAENVDIVFASSMYELEEDLNNDRENTKETQTKRTTRESMKNVISFLDGNKKIGKNTKTLIKNFVDTVYAFEKKLEKDNKPTTIDGMPIEKYILDYIHNNPNDALANVAEDWIKLMEEKGISIKQHSGFARLFGAKGVTALQQIAQAYVAANNINGADNYPGFQVFTNIIREKGSFEDAYHAFDENMEKTKKFTKENKKREERFSTLTGEAGVYEDVSSNIDTMIDILSDFNLDGHINYGDAYNKTGLQLKEMFNDEQGLTKGVKMENLINAFNKGKIEVNNAKNIFTNQTKFDTLQEFVQHPPIDLHLILQYGDEAIQQNVVRQKEILDAKAKIAEEAREQANTLKQNAQIQLDNLDQKESLTAEEHQKKTALEELLKIPQEEFYHGLKDLLEGQLANMTQNGVGLAAGVSLDKVLSGLSFNVGWASNEDWTKGFGVNLSRNGSQELGNGRGIYEGISAGTVLLTVPIVTGNAGVYKVFKNPNLAKDISTKVRKTDKVVNAGIHGFTTPGLVAWGVDVGIDANRRDAVERKYTMLKGELSGFVLDILDAMKDDDGTFIYDREKLKGSLKDKYPKTKEKALEKAVDNMEEMLQFYTGADLSNDDMKTVITENIAQAYALQWKNEALQNLDDDGRYLSGGGLSVTFLESIIPVVGILKFKKHRITRSSDTWESREDLRNANEKGTGNIEKEGNILENIDALNNSLGTRNLLAQEGDLVKIDMKKLQGVELHIDPAMDGLIKKSADGNILIHPDTPIRALKGYLGRGQLTVLNIGDHETDPDDIIIKNASDIYKLSPYIVNDSIDPNKLPYAFDKQIDLPTQDSFNSLKHKLKKEIKDEELKNTLDSIQLVRDSEHNTVVVYENNAYELGKGNDLKIFKNEEGQISIEIINRAKNKNFSILVEMSSRSEKEDPINIGIETQKQIDNFYDQMPKITSNMLANISHNPAEYGLGTLYTNWRDALERNNFEEAKNTMIKMLPIIENFINQKQAKGNEVDFENQISFLNSEESRNIQKNQLLLALDGMFSRTTNVKGNGKGGYNLEYGQTGKNAFENIIKYNKEAITEKMENEGIDSNVIQVYEKIFDKMNKEYESLEGPIMTQKLLGLAYNYGNRQDNERPIINPEIVAGSYRQMNQLGLSSEELKTIKTHMAEQMITNDRAIIQPMIHNLKEKIGTKLSEEELITMIVEGKIEKTLDNRKTIIINSEYTLATALFAQCVNHMVVAQDIKFKVDGKDINITGENYSAQLKGEGNTVAVNNGEGSSTYDTNSNSFSVAATHTFEKKHKTPEDGTTVKGNKTQENPENETIVKDLDPVEVDENLKLNSVNIDGRDYSLIKYKGQYHAQVDGELVPIYHTLDKKGYSLESKITIPSTSTKTPPEVDLNQEDEIPEGASKYRGSGVGAQLKDEETD